MLIVGIKAQDSLICVDKLGLKGTLFELDSLEFESQAQDSLIELFKKDTTQAKLLIRAQGKHIKTLKKQRLKYKKNWVSAIRESRNKDKYLWLTGALCVISLMF